MAKYTVQTWTDGVSALSAARMTVLENGIREASMGRSTTFPSSPVDGDIHVYPAETTDRVMWMFMFRTASTKWEFIGGAPLWEEVETAETETNTAYDDMATAGPSITVPKGGDYLIQFQAKAQVSASAGFVGISPKIGAAAASANDEALINPGVSLTEVFGGQRVKTCAASDVIKLQYKVQAGTVTFSNRRLWITPIWVTP